MQLAGAFNVLSAVVPAHHGRMAALLEFVPAAGILSARAATAAVGVLLIYLGTGLRRGKHRAWQLAVALAGAGVALHILKGLDFDAAAVSAALLAMLIVVRKRFHAIPDPRSRWRALAALIGCTSWGPLVIPGSAVAVARGPAIPDVLAFGDSVPAGSACGCEPFPVLYARKLAADGQATNLARSGFTSGDVLSQVDDPVVQTAIRSASVIVIMIGANDLAAVFASGGDTAAYQSAAAAVDANVTMTLRRIRATRIASVPILVLGYWNVVEDGDVARADYSAADTAKAATITGYANDALRAAATAGSAAYVPTMAVFKGPTGASNPTSLLTSDGDHPNARGHAAIAAALYAAQPTTTQ